MPEPFPIPKDMLSVGTCSMCWGRVCRPLYNSAGTTPKTMCLDCGAVPRPMYGAIVEMVMEEAP